MATDTLKQHDAHAHDGHEHHDTGAIKVFGFWVYLMSDLVIFGTLFATFAVLLSGTAGGPGASDIVELPLIFVSTIFLLVSSFTFGLAILAQTAGDKGGVLKWLAVTFLLGLGFICLEIYEFHHLIAEGFGPDRSAFLSGFFTLVGTHGLHVSLGLVWILIMFFQISKQGLSDVTKPRMLCLSLFWHFLDIVWICVFSFVYLFGAMS
ncbi:cytochrome o ubiquinol oxidase subunit III [Salinicola halophilus]|uniref:cytochrome o ubiquinol oxidase subunit III n=1 Tax=Salinicola halophilus TaxID=184065 RepID=UPI000DA20581|nr:cytochrome o ubiquinol oxidase subunit III [Salinicola halophilus]